MSSTVNILLITIKAWRATGGGRVLVKFRDVVLVLGFLFPRPRWLCWGFWHSSGSLFVCSALVFKSPLLTIHLLLPLRKSLWCNFLGSCSLFLANLFLISLLLMLLKDGERVSWWRSFLYEEEIVWIEHHCMLCLRSFLCCCCSILFPGLSFIYPQSEMVSLSFATRSR